MKRVAKVAVLDAKNNKMLMGRRRDNNRYTEPGGHINEGESPVMGAVREVYEETGMRLTPSDLELIEEKMVPGEKGQQLKVYGYRAVFKDRVPTTIKMDPDGEIKRWEWIPFTERGVADFVKQNMHVPLFKNVIHKNFNQFLAQKKQAAAPKKARRFWEASKKFGRGGFHDPALREAAEEVVQNKVEDRARVRK